MKSRQIFWFLVLITLPTLSNAFQCTTLEPFYLAGENPTVEKRAADKAAEFLEIFSYRETEDKLVFGTFYRASNLKLDHLDYLDRYRNNIRNGAETRLPNSVEFTYLNEFRFEGYQIIDGVLEPFQTDKIAMRVSIHEEYGGMAGQLPSIEKEVAGLLTHSHNDWFLVEIFGCPIFFELSKIELDALLLLDKG